jgi:NOL1/NOP2/fmu family ribosome biogenesis protein
MQGLIHNIKRCGLMNEAVISISGQKVQRVFVDYFDRILIDAPCSAEGTIRKSKAVLYHWGIRNIERMSRIQIGLAVSGFRALRPGGLLVYSTCTIAPEENEMVVSYLLKKFPEAELLPVGLRDLRIRPGITNWQGVRFDPRITNCARILPQDNDTAPFFIAKVTKKGSAEPRMRNPERIEFDSVLVERLVNRFGVEAGPFKQYAVFKNRDESFIATPEAFSFRAMKTVRKGLEFGRVYGCDIKPDNDLVQLFGSCAKRNVIDLEDWQVEKFLKGEIIKIDHRPDIDKGFVITRFQNLVLGVGRYNGQEIKSAIKRERRIQ